MRGAADDGTIEPNARPGGAYSPFWRVVAALLVAVSGASMPALLGVVVVATDPPMTLPVLLRLVTALVLLPNVAARLIARASAVTVEINKTRIVLYGRGLRLEIPFRAIGRIAPWSVPLPGPGLSLWMRSGQRLSYGLHTADPAVVLAAVAEAGDVQAARAAARHPAVAYAHAKGSVGPWQWYHALLKFPLFGLLPTAVLFNAHQHIAYGGTWGQYYLLGAAAYAGTFATYWLTTTIYLALYASVWRGLAESSAWLASWFAPAHALPVRRSAEALCRVAYYVGVPVLLGVRFLA
jgi:hypothetical protein